MLEGDGGHIKELYRRGQAHEQLGTDRLGLAMKDYTRLLNMWNAPRTRLAPSAQTCCSFHYQASWARPFSLRSPHAPRPRYSRRLHPE